VETQYAAAGCGSTASLLHTSYFAWRIGWFFGGIHIVQIFLK